MKKNLLFFILLSTLGVALAALDFKNEGNDPLSYEGLIPEEYADDFVKKVDSKTLLADATLKFSGEFDKVERIDIHINGDLEVFSYYVLYGVKEGEAKTLMVKMNPGDLENETISAIECSLGYCVTAPQHGIPCSPEPFGILCGCRTSSGGCVVW